MADLYEMLLVAELPADLPEAELAELRWHLGLGPEPDRFAIVTDGLPVVTADDEGEPLPEALWTVEHLPLLAGRGAADPRIGGALFSGLVRREGPRDANWALTSRQVLHPDDRDQFAQLLGWLRRRAVGHRGAPPCLTCHLRHHEDGPALKPVALDGAEPLMY
ncbi:hypothetical protein [Actinomadura sp. NEAU-AAG7]|uniref:hypothetical protein n=1 Tax=Actinomadura sp. NEAU-AAG7 TaxID=2839640 RepID=UPI001BE3E9E8|nr:hypothetical protein [Actinomadura sp. NEAU-AAG7]MBT2208231.1 hypothetical protein [Actinomadura sp. NEAU-AAG7]